MLNIGLLTSWNTRCGIAEYSRALSEALRRIDGVTVAVFGSRNVGDRAVRAYEEYARPVFDVQAWSPTFQCDLDVDDVLSRDLDVLHVQYSNLFYNRRRLVELLRRFRGVTALTYHDKIVSNRIFPHRMIDVLYAHRPDVGTGPRRLIPQGLEVRKPVIKTFGLGKSRDDVIEAICARNEWSLEKSYGQKRWLERDELYRWLRDCDAIVLWYHNDRTSGGSAAAPFAISTRRPVFVNDVEWFRDLPERTTTLRKLKDANELEAELRTLLVDHYADERSWDRVARTLVDDYVEALRRRDDGNRSHDPAAVRPHDSDRFKARLFGLLDPKPLIKYKRRFIARPLLPSRRLTG